MWRWKSIRRLRKINTSFKWRKKKRRIGQKGTDDDSGKNSTRDFFKDVSSSYFIAPNGRIIDEYRIGKICKKGAVTRFKAFVRGDWGRPRKIREQLVCRKRFQPEAVRKVSSTGDNLGGMIGGYIIAWIYLTVYGLLYDTVNSSHRVVSHYNTMWTLHSMSHFIALLWNLVGSVVFQRSRKALNENKFYDDNK